MKVEWSEVVDGDASRQRVVVSESKQQLMKLNCRYLVNEKASFTQCAAQERGRVQRCKLPKSKISRRRCLAVGISH